MRPAQTCPTCLEQLEPRLLLNAGWVFSELFDSVQVVNVNPTESVSLQGNIQANGPTQTYRFDAPASGKFWIDMCAQDSQLDSLLQVYRQNGRRMGYNDNASRNTTDSRLRIRVRPSETYYVVATSRNGTTGAYELTLTSDPTDDVGNTVSTAKKLRVGRGRARAVNAINYAGDVDMFKIVADRSGPMEVDLAGTRRGNLAPELYVYDDQGGQLAYATGSVGDHAHASLDVEAGQAFYIRVSGDQVGARARLTVNLPSDDLPNDIADSPLLRLRRGRGRLRGVTNYTGDTDVVQVVASSTAPMQISVSGVSRRNGFSGELFVYDSAGTQVGYGVGTDGGGVSLSVNVTQGQTYYIKVAGEYGWRPSRYRMTVNCPIDDAPDTFDGAVAMGLTNGAASQSGKINFLTDADMFQVVESMTGSMTVGVSAYGFRNTLDPVVTIYDADFNQIAFDNDAGQGVSASATVNVSQGATYYVLVSSSDDATVGRYRISLQTAEGIPPDPDPDPDPNPNPDPDPDPGQTPTPGDEIVAQLLDTGNGFQLQIVGTDGADIITLSQSGGTLTLTTATNTQTFSSALAGLLIYGFGGNDTIRLTSTVTLSGSIYAGDGNDTIFEAGLAGMTVNAGAGDDLLVTIGGGGDTLAGGAGLDSFWYDSADTVTDASNAETAARSVHSISEFYQPYSTNPTSPDYVSLSIAGQDLADSTATSSASDWSNFASMPLFVNGPQRNDIRQGAIGDCYYLASLAGLTDSDPMIIQQMITPLGDGTYAVRFNRSGQEVYLRIDADLPVNTYGSLVYAKAGHDGELWVPLLEKAYTYFRSGANSYASINGGWMSTVLREITGGYTNTTYTGGSLTSLFNHISSMLSQGYAVTAGTTYNATSPVVSNHAYSIVAAETIAGQQYVTVYNPWGWDGRAWDDNQYDGLLTLSIQQIQDNYTAIVTSLV